MLVLTVLAELLVMVVALAVGGGYGECWETSLMSVRDALASKTERRPQRMWSFVCDAISLSTLDGCGGPGLREPP